MLERDDGEWTDYEDAMEVITILREALESLLVYTKHIKRRAGVQMNDPNTGSVLAAEEALQRAGGGE